MDENKKQKSFLDGRLGILVVLVALVVAALALSHAYYYDYDSHHMPSSYWMMSGMHGSGFGMYGNPANAGQNAAGQGGYGANGDLADYLPGNAGFTQNHITVLQPLPSSTVSLPLNVLGYGLPPFEGVPGYYQILDASGKMVLQHNLLPANLGMMQPYGFLAVINGFTLPASSKGEFTLRIHNGNPSGLAENDRIISIPLKLLK